MAKLCNRVMAYHEHFGCEIIVCNIIYCLASIYRSTVAVFTELLIQLRCLRMIY